MLLLLVALDWVTNQRTAPGPRTLLVLLCKDLACRRDISNPFHLWHFTFFPADMGGLHGALHGQVHRNQLHLSRTHPGGLAASSQDDEDEVQQGLMMMPEIEELEQQQHEALSNDEAHDQLMELPYGGARGAM